MRARQREFVTILAIIAGRARRSFVRPLTHQHSMARCGELEARTQAVQSAAHRFARGFMVAFSSDSARHDRKNANMCVHTLAHTHTHERTHACRLPTPAFIGRVPTPLASTHPSVAAASAALKRAREKFALIRNAVCECVEFQPDVFEQCRRRRCCPFQQHD